MVRQFKNTDSWSGAGGTGRNLSQITAKFIYAASQMFMNP